MGLFSENIYCLSSKGPDVTCKDGEGWSYLLFKRTGSAIWRRIGTIYPWSPFQCPTSGEREEVSSRCSPLFILDKLCSGEKYLCKRCLASLLTRKDYSSNCMLMNRFTERNEMTLKIILNSYLKLLQSLMQKSNRW